MKRKGVVVSVDRRKTEKGYTIDSLLSWSEKVDECLEWNRARNQNGYGIAQHDGKQWMAHRLSYHLNTGENISGAVIHHICSNASCVNPKHLQRASQADNGLEMLARKDYEAEIARLQLRVIELEAELERANV
jgi:hypothetical protein